MDTTELRKEKIKTWLKNPYNSLLLLLILFTVFTRLYYFSLTSNQPTWWDEGDYLALAKEFALPSAETPEWWGHFTLIRPLLMSFIWAVFIKLNLSEAVMRFLTEIIPSILLVIFSYLTASSLFNKKIGLITGFITSIYWVIMFYSLRFMTDIPAMLFALMSLYYYWEYYEKNNWPIGLYLCIFLGVLGFLTRFSTALVIFSALFYLLLKKKYKFVTDKHIWIAGIVGIATLLPYFIYNFITKGSFFPAFAFYGTENTIVITEIPWILLKYGFYQLIGWQFAIILFIGMVDSLLTVFLGWSLFWNQKDKKINSHIFIFLWLIFQIYFFVFYQRVGNDRHILLWMPPIFIYISLGLEKISFILNKYYKYAGLLFIFCILFLGGLFHLEYANQLIKVKLDSYKEIQDTGLWLRDNSPENAKILGASIVQNSYYSQRRTYSFFIGTELYKMLINEEHNLEGQLVAKSYQLIWNETELECKIVRIKPDFLILHPWEPAFTPEFMFDYPQRHNDTLVPIQTFMRNGQLTAVIYKFIDYPIIDPQKVNCTWVYDRPENITGIPLKIKDPYVLIIPS